MKTQHSFWNIPNTISLTRLPLAILFVLFIHNTAAALTIIIIALLTDYLDGTFARTYRKQTATGAFVDPLMDKLFVGTAAIALHATITFPFWKLFMILFREIFMIFFIGVTATTAKRTCIIRLAKARMFGKITTVLQFISIIFIMLRFPFQTHLIFITFIFSVLASYDYLKRYHALYP